jgi:hypothetical protein
MLMTRTILLRHQLFNMVYWVLSCLWLLTSDLSIQLCSMNVRKHTKYVLKHEKTSIYIHDAQSLVGVMIHVPELVRINGLR